MARLDRVDVLVVDDWAMAPLQETERRDFWEICEERYQTRSTILTSQIPVAQWHEQIGDPTTADGILDRLVHNAHRIELHGESLRKTRTRKPDKPHPGSDLHSSGSLPWIPNQKPGLRFAPDGGSLTISDHFRHNQHRQRRFAPIS